MCVGIYYCDIVLSASRIISETIIYNICLIIYNHILYNNNNKEHKRLLFHP